MASRAPPRLNPFHIPAVAQHWGLGVSSFQGNHHLPPLVFAEKFALKTSSPLQLKTQKQLIWMLDLPTLTISTSKNYTRWML